MDKFRLWFVRDEFSSAVLFCDTLGVYSITDAQKEILVNMNNGITVEDSQDKNVVMAMLKRERQAIVNMQGKDCDNNPFYSLILNISNVCNMRCEYCFANHGSYNSEKGIMSTETAIAAVDKCYSHYGYIGEIKFFGGEPLIAFNVMKAVCEYIAESKECGKISQLPVFRIITNGTIMNEDIALMIKKYSVNYVISIDGPADIHDQCRKMSNGDGSLEKILENINFFKKITGDLPTGIEITYNGIHEKNDVHILSIMEFLQNEIGMSPENINLSPVTMKGDSPCNLDSMDYVLEGYLDEIAEEARKSGINKADKKFRGIINIIKGRKRSGNQICEAGMGCLSVSAYGKLYPCYMFTDNPDMYMGELNDDLG